MRQDYRKRDKRRLRAAASAIALVALLLRLIWPMPAATGAERGLLGSGGPAHCHPSLGHGEDRAPAPPDAPRPPGGHHDHDGGACCPSQAAGATILPGSPAPAGIAFPPGGPPVLASAPLPASRSVGLPQARAPPSQA